MSQNFEMDIDLERKLLIKPSKETNEDNIERSAIRKLNWRILPFCFSIILICYVDRGNLGFAANQFCEALNLTASEYGLGASLFYVGYSLIQLPTNYFVERLGAPILFTIMMFFWGLFAGMLAFATNKYHYYILRILLGFAEAGTFPAVWYYMTIMFPAKNLTFALVIAEVALTISTPVSSPIAAGILQMDNNFGLAGWQWLFILEGFIPMAFSACFYICLPKNISEAYFLTEAEKNFLEVEEHKKTIMDDLMDPFKQILIVIKNPYFWALTIIKFMRDVISTTASYFMTLIIEAMISQDNDSITKDQSNGTCSSSTSLGATSVLLTAIPYIFSSIMVFVTGYISQRLNLRSKVGGSYMFFCALFFCLYPIFESINTAWAIMALSIGVSGLNGPFTLIISLMITHAGDGSQAMALALFNTFGMMGGFVGPSINGFIIENYGYNTTIISIGFLMIVASVSLFMIPEKIRQR